MRMQDEASRDVRGARDQHVKQRQGERKAVQKKTFTRWMNVFLQRLDPPVVVNDLFTDVQDGRILMALLEELSECKLLYRFRSSPHRIFRVNNISKVLAFLDDRHVKLLGIDADDVADGVPSVVLHLTWIIILYFQVKEATRGLQKRLSSSLSSLSMSSYPSASDLSPQPDDIGSYSCSTLPSKRNAAREPKYHGRAIKTLLQWVQMCTSKFGVEVHDFGKSWRTGLAFLAMIKSINPTLVNLRESLCREPRESLQLAFTIAHHSLDMPPLLEPEDVACASPDEQSIITYVSMFMGRYSGIDEDHTTDFDADVPDIPNFGSAESVSLGETPAEDPAAQGLLRCLEKSSEQELWKRWSGRSSGGLHPTSSHVNGAVVSDFPNGCQSTEQPGRTSQLNKKKGRHVSQPPSPLDAGGVGQDIRSWMEKGSVDQGYSRSRADESRFSFSSEEGIYSLSALDSDEEDAYSYILDLSKDAFQPYNQLTRQVARVEEETAEEMILNGQLADKSEHLDVSDMLNTSGCKPQEGPLAQNVVFDPDLEVGAPSLIQREFDLDRNDSSVIKMANNRSESDMAAAHESRSNEASEERRVVTGQSNEVGDYGEKGRGKEKMENPRLVKNGHDETVSGVVEEASWRTQTEEETGGCGQLSKKREVDKEEEEEKWSTFNNGQNRRLKTEREKEDDAKEGKRVNKQNVHLEMSKTGNERMLIDESVCAVRGMEDETKGAAKSEDLMKNCRDEEKEEDTDGVKNSLDCEAVKTIDERLWEPEFKSSKQTTEKKATTTEHPETTPDNNTKGRHDSDDDVTSASSQSFSEGGLRLQSFPASCDVTPLELETLLVLWILLYCCIILPQMNP